MVKFVAALLLVACLALTHGQLSYDAQLGLSIQFCQRCGTPGLDDFCIKRYGRWGQTVPAVGNAGFGTFGGPTGRPPHGYFSGVTNNVPNSCVTLKQYAAAIPNRGLQTNSIPVYVQTGDWGATVPRVFFNPIVAQFLPVQYPLDHYLDNNARFPNGVWNYANPSRPVKNAYRLDSFYYQDTGNNTWSYQCYCDWCQQAQQCTNG
ncbi:unnamed protein product [Lymnaea stagnalis]|uniref:Secreted protein n=1 Tax=Lymnaea stagnalis TaxID=6523 RepID=A0AAV2I7E1_LYMST